MVEFCTDAMQDEVEDSVVVYKRAIGEAKAFEVGLVVGQSFDGSGCNMG
jgi:hypothetical protein